MRRRYCSFCSERSTAHTIILLEVISGTLATAIAMKSERQLSNYTSTNCTSLIDYPENCTTAEKNISTGQGNIENLLNDFCTPKCVKPFVDYTRIASVPPSSQPTTTTIFAASTGTNIVSLRRPHDQWRYRLRGNKSNFLQRIVRKHAKNRGREMGMLRSKLLRVHWSNVRRRSGRCVRRSGRCGNWQPCRARPDNDLCDRRCFYKSHSLLMV